MDPSRSPGKTSDSWDIFIVRVIPKVISLDWRLLWELIGSYYNCIEWHMNKEI